MATVELGLLGPLRLVVDGTPVEVRGTKRRAVLVLLAQAEGRTVPVDRLLDALWSADDPAFARQALHSQVFRLRGQLAAAADRLRTQPDGYRLELAAGELDVARARALLAAGRAGTPADPASAYARLGEAHALWRGPVLADLTDIAPIAAAVAGYAQLWRDVTDALIASGVAAGQADAVLGLAESAAAVDPLREPAILGHMRALAATGRAPEALRVGREFRRRLADETGLDPSPALAELARVIAAGGVPVTPAPAGSHPTAGANPAGVAVRPVARPATALIGRAPQVAALHQLLASQRLVTLVGPGGVGKTRVALEVACRSEPAPVLPLASVSDPAAIPHALAAVLGLEVSQGDVRSAVLAVLADQRGLLVIDNCEHLLDPVRELVDAILAVSARLSVLTTSREPLGLAAEYAYRLAPLALPEPDQDLTRVPSVVVFLDRAARVRPRPAPTPAELATIADIVRRLDGMPLAIELAAGRLSSFSLTDLRDRLDRALDLLGGGPRNGDRHQTLRATVDWSYQLLTDDEQRLFRHLSVFVDGVDLATAERVGAGLGLTTDPGSVLARLVDASMLDAEFAPQTRYRMLHTLRAFGLDRLAATGEQEAAVGGMLSWAVALTGWIEATIRTEREPLADAALRRELPNLRAAWRCARDRGDIDAAATMVTSLYDAVVYRDLMEIRDWADELVDDPALADHPLAAVVFGTAAEAAYHRGDYPRSARLAQAGLERAGADTAQHCLLALCVVHLARGAYADSARYALAAASGDRISESRGLAALATAYGGDLERARELHRQGTGAVSNTARAWHAYVAGEIDHRSGHAPAAERHYQAALALARSSGATFLVGVTTVGLLSVQADTGRVHEALAGYRDVIDYFTRTGNWTHLWVTLRNLAGLLRRLGDREPAALLSAAADQAPDAPATEPVTGPAGPTVTVTGGGGAAGGAPDPGRQAVLATARQAIERNLTRGGRRRGNA